MHRKTCSQWYSKLERLIIVHVRHTIRTLLLIGGMRGEEQRASLAKGASRGFTVQQGKINPVSEN